MNSSTSPVELYEWMLSKRDPRVLQLPLPQLSSPAMVFTIFVGYLALVKQGPKLMLNKKAWDITKLVIVYNTALVLFSGYMFYEILKLAYLAGYSLICEVVDYSSSSLGLKAAFIAWMYYLSKIVEITDTVFLIVRKKPVSFLHSYHHACMLIISWIGAIFIPGGQGFFAIVVNLFVHVVMYTYYFLSAMGPNVQKYLWWKKYITRLQLTQFGMIFIHTVINTFQTDCDYPRSYNYMMMVFQITLLALFLNFYHKAYRQNKHPRIKQS